MKALHGLDSPHVPQSAQAPHSTQSIKEVRLHPKRPSTDSDSAQPVGERQRETRPLAEHDFGDTFYASPRPTIYIVVSPSASSKRQCHDQNSKEEGRRSASLLVAYFLEKWRVRPTMQRDSHFRMAAFRIHIIQLARLGALTLPSPPAT